jgi:hypothetical protein
VADIEQHLTDELRTYISEMADGAARQADIVIRYCDIGDDTGMSYALRQMLAYVRAAVATQRDLAERRRAAEKEGE